MSYISNGKGEKMSSSVIGFGVFNMLKSLHPARKSYIRVPYDNSKLLKSKLAKFEQWLNIKSMFLVFFVLKLLTFKSAKLEHEENIPPMFVMFDVSKLLTSRFFSPEQPQNI